MNARILWSIASDYSDVEATSEAYGCEAVNVKHPHRNKVWLTGVSTALERIVFDLYEATAVNCFFALNHDLSAADTGIKFMMNATDAWGAPSFSHSCTWRLDDLAEMFTTKTYRFAAFEFTKSAAAQQRQIGRICFGSYYECARNPDRDSIKWGESDRSKTINAESGASYSDIRGMQRTLSLGWSRIPNSQADEFRDIAHTVGEHTPFIISLDHTNYPIDWMIYGKQSGLKPRKYVLWNGGTPKWAADLEIREEV